MRRFQTGIRKQTEISKEPALESRAKVIAVRMTELSAHIHSSSTSEGMVFTSPIASKNNANDRACEIKETSVFEIFFGAWQLRRTIDNRLYKIISQEKDQIKT